MSDKAYEIVEIAKKTGSLKKGTNEVTKAIERGKAQFVAVAQDVSPKEIIMHIPILAKEKGIPCVQVPSREELGVAAGLGVSAVAVAVTDSGDAKDEIKSFAVEETETKEQSSDKTE
ncbi:MAG: ribosomal L7Ae/L30e/S12e/Gadd45 family protein [Candidatus Woesearchaeota archaeon]